MKKGTYYSTLKDHKQNKKIFTPPLLMENTQLVSWTNEGLPELLWIVLLTTHLPREIVFRIFAKIGDELYRLRQESKISNSWDCTMSGLASIDNKVFEKIMKIVLSFSNTVDALRPVLLFKKLPGYKRWKRLLSTEPLCKEDWRKLYQSIENNFVYQSQKATDCCLLSIMFLSAAGRIYIPEERDDLIKEVNRIIDAANRIIDSPSLNYFEGTDSSIRAMWLGIGITKKTTSDWINDFWKVCYQMSPCILITNPAPAIFKPTKVFIKRILNFRIKLAIHFLNTIESTGIDAKHDTVFGLASYGMQILIELVQKAGSHICGRMALRSIVDVLIILTYISKKQDMSLWQKYRDYGSGQAKLTFMTFDAHPEATEPSYADKDNLERLANEDKWQEYTPVNVGNWNQTNIREMAQEVGLSDLYSLYYTWPSSYSHAHWSSVNEARFIRCGNPLHRYHKILSPLPSNLPDVLPDACDLVDKILEMVDFEYPKFSFRINLKRKSKIKSAGIAKK